MLSYALRVIKGAHSDSRNENNFHNWEICLSSVFSFRDVDLLTWPHLIRSKSEDSGIGYPAKKLNFPQISPKMPQNGPKMAKNDPKWPKVAQI